MKESDIESILGIERMCFPAPWRRQFFLDEINNPYSLNVLIKENDVLESSAIYAYSCCHVLAEEMTLLRLAVVPEKHREGLGALLLGTVLDEAARRGTAKVYLEVRESNIQALSFYRKHGFRVVGTRPNYYPETGENALVMMKSLKEIS